MATDLITPESILFPDGNPEGGSSVSESDKGYEAPAGTPGQPSQCVKDAIKIIRDQIYTTDQSSRYDQVRELKRNEIFWEGGVPYWDAVSRDWLSVSDALLKSDGGDDLGVDPSLFNKRVNVYRSLGEAVIGALTTGFPDIRFFPDDAENADDINTSKAYSKISEKIQLDNEAKLLLTKAVTSRWNQNFVAAYNYSHFDVNHGTVKSKIYGNGSIDVNSSYCPFCGDMLNQDVKPSSNDGSSSGGRNLSEGNVETNAEVINSHFVLDDQFNSSGALNKLPITEQDVLDHIGPDPSLSENPELTDPSSMMECPTCGLVNPQQEQTQEQVPVVIDEKDIPKARQIIEIYGPMNVHIPPFAVYPKDIGYLILYTEAHYAQLRSLYPWIKNKIQPGPDLQSYNRWSRTGTWDLFAETELVTVQRLWLKPWMYEVLGDNNKQAYDELCKDYPNGTYAVFVNDIFAECYNESLDDHWSISISPTDPRILADPLGKPLIPIQEMTDDLVSLTMETIKYGVPVTFADPRSLDFDAWKQTTAGPGKLYPAARPSDRSLADMFTTTKTATLSQEVGPFLDKLEYFGQLVSSAFPSIFGGQSDAKTLGELNNSKAVALQRLGITWMSLNFWWAQVMSKATKCYALDMLEDEKFSQRLGTNFINVTIKTNELGGKVGRVYPEGSEQFPLSWEQKRNNYFELIKLNNEMIISVLGRPENIHLFKEVTGLMDLYVPGDDDRNKELDDIAQLLLGQPIPVGLGPDGMPIFQPSIPIEPEVGNVEVCLEVAKSFLSGPIGQEHKKYNPGGYENVKAQINSFNQYLAMQAQMAQQQAMAMQAQNQPNPGNSGNEGNQNGN